MFSYIFFGLFKGKSASEYLLKYAAKMIKKISQWFKIQASNDEPYYDDFRSFDDELIYALRSISEFFNAGIVLKVGQKWDEQNAASKAPSPLPSIHIIGRCF